MIAHFIVLRVVLHCNKFRPLRIQRVSLIESDVIALVFVAVPRSYASVLKTTVLGACSHVISLVRLPTGSSDRSLEAAERIRGVQIYVACACVSLGLSRLLLLQHTHSD